MFGRDVGALEVDRGRSLVNGFATAAAVVEECGAEVEKGEDDDEDYVADDVPWGGCEAEASG